MNDAIFCTDAGDIHHDAKDKWISEMLYVITCIVTCAI